MSAQGIARSRDRTGDNDIPVHVILLPLNCPVGPLAIQAQQAGNTIHQPRIERVWISLRNQPVRVFFR
jgi:hypothetical protein